MFSLCASLSSREMKGGSPASSSEAMGSMVLHSQNEPVGAGAPKSTTAIQLVGHTGPREAASALFLPLGLSCGNQMFPLSQTAQPHFPCKEEVAVYLFPYIGLASSTQGFATPAANGHFVFVILFPAIVQDTQLSTQRLPGLALISSSVRFQASIKSLRGLRPQSNEKQGALLCRPWPVPLKLSHLQIIYLQTHRKSDVSPADIIFSLLMIIPHGIWCDLISK